MKSETRGLESEAVVIAPTDGGWSWSVVARSQVHVQGKEADPASAWRTGAFAAGALDAFARIAQRR